jgi:glutathione S-transferase
VSIQLYTWDTPNGRKISIALEEMGLPYTVHLVNIFNGEQFDPAFLKINPNSRIPAVVDPTSPGILIFLVLRARVRARLKKLSSKRARGLMEYEHAAEIQSKPAACPCAVHAAPESRLSSQPGSSHTLRENIT